MQTSIARHEKLFFVHVALPQIHIEKDDFASSNSTKHVMYESLRAHKKNQKQSNLSLTMLKSISLSGNDVFSQSRVKMIVCTSDLNSTFDTNAWAIIKTLLDNLRSNSPLSRKTKTKLLRKCHFCSGFLWEKSLSETIGLPKKMEFKLPSIKEIKNFPVILAVHHNNSSTRYQIKNN